MRTIIGYGIEEEKVQEWAEALSEEFSAKTDYLFQPIVDVRNGKHEIYGYEALLRTKEESPENFIKKMRLDGRNHDLELFSFYEGIVRFADRELDGKLFINSLPHQLLTDAEFDFLGNSPVVFNKRVVVENLEDDLMFDAAMLLKKKEKLRERGYMIALDDYGTGINSVRALKLFKPDIVKIDKSYVTGAVRDSARMNALEIMIDEIKNQGAAVLAEGVETWVEYETLRYLGVDFMQGFYLGIPE